MAQGYFPESPNAEYIAREGQAPADLVDYSGRLAGAKDRALARATPGEPPVLYDVRCIFDSRPTNGYDFNFAAQTVEGLNPSTTVTFIVPSGYRAVPRKWLIDIEPMPVALLSDITATVQVNGADLPNNTRFIGTGLSDPFETFFVVEENAQFGMRLDDPFSLIGTSTINVQVYGNLIPVTGVALPFEVTNRKA